MKIQDAEVKKLMQQHPDTVFRTNRSSAFQKIEFESNLDANKFSAELSRMRRHQPLQSLFASDYLAAAQPYLKGLVPEDNLQQILSLARYFPGNLTSFVGFECRLGRNDAPVDWALVISGEGTDRRVFSYLLQEGYLPSYFLQHASWRQISDFASAWANPASVLNDKVQCFWLEFDMSETDSTVMVPSVFFGPKKIQDTRYRWLTSTALPLLRGSMLSKDLEQKLNLCLSRMPSNVSLFQVGTLLSRSSENGIRLYLNRFKPDQIISYLSDIGYTSDISVFSELVYDLEGKADRFVISFDVNATGIGSRLGLELSFFDNLYHQEMRWKPLLEHLVEKKLCLPERCDALLAYPGFTSDQEQADSVMIPLHSASLHLHDLLTSRIVRYISHLKIVYEPGHTMEAKAYPAVRLFQPRQERSVDGSLMVKNKG